MEIQEKVAYLKGLTEGMSLDPQAKETKLLAAVTDILDAMAKEIRRLDDSDDVLHNMLEDLSDELLDLTEDLEDEEAEETLYEILCPSCDKETVIDEDMLDNGEMICPHCGEDLEFDAGDEGEEP